MRARHTAVSNKLLLTLLLAAAVPAQIGYEFAVALGGGVRDGLVTNQNKFDRDWTPPGSTRCARPKNSGSSSCGCRGDWIPAPRHELRVKWQWIGIDAEPRAAYRTDAAGRLLVAPEPLAPFTANNLGLQIRYRHEIGPLSELFLVHARGGLDLQRDDERSVGEPFGHMSDVRDADQFMIKMRYRL